MSPTSKVVPMVFKGWYLARGSDPVYSDSSNGGIQVNSPYTPTGNITLYAVYSYPAIGTLPVPTRSGYTFNSWTAFTPGGVLVTSSYIVYTDITICANWTSQPDQYTVTFNAGVQGASVSPTSLTVAAGDSIILPTPTWSGSNAIFVGWYAGSERDGKVGDPGDNYTPTCDITLYGDWGTPSQYTVTFDANGGTVSPGSQTVYIDGQLVILPIPTRSGYICTGWYTALDGGRYIADPGEGIYIVADITYYAQWTPSS